MKRDDAARAIELQCEEIKAMLLQKNDTYGNSALNPLRIFSRQNSTEQLLVRIDDKLSRIKRGDPNETEDTILDLIGYLILLRVSKE